jgi:hypothetical protein
LTVAQPDREREVGTKFDYRSSLSFARVWERKIAFKVWALEHPDKETFSKTNKRDNYLLVSIPEGALSLHIESYIRVHVAL